MKACLQMQPECSSREKLLYYFKRQQNEKPTLKGNRFEQAIIKKAECSIIHNRIRCINIKINYLQTEIANIKTSLQQKLDEPTFTILQNIIFNNKENIFLQYKNTQIKKLKASSPQQPPRWPPRQLTLSILLSPLLLPQVSRTSQ